MKHSPSFKITNYELSLILWAGENENKSTSLKIVGDYRRGRPSKDKKREKGFFLYYIEMGKRCRIFCRIGLVTEHLIYFLALVSCLSNGVNRGTNRLSTSSFPKTEKFFLTFPIYTQPNTFTFIGLLIALCIELKGFFFWTIIHGVRHRGLPSLTRDSTSYGDTVERVNTLCALHKFVVTNSFNFQIIFFLF